MPGWHVNSGDNSGWKVNGGYGVDMDRITQHDMHQGVTDIRDSYHYCDNSVTNIFLGGIAQQQPSRSYIAGAGIGGAFSALIMGLAMRGIFGSGAKAQARYQLTNLSYTPPLIGDSFSLSGGTGFGGSTYNLATTGVINTGAAATPKKTTAKDDDDDDDATVKKSKDKDKDKVKAKEKEKAEEPDKTTKKDNDPKVTKKPEKTTTPKATTTAKTNEDYTNFVNGSGSGIITGESVHHLEDVKGNPGEDNVFAGYAGEDEAKAKETVKTGDAKGLLTHFRITDKSGNIYALYSPSRNGNIVTYKLDLAHCDFKQDDVKSGDKITDNKFAQNIKYKPDTELTVEIKGDVLTVTNGSGEPIATVHKEIQKL